MVQKISKNQLLEQPSVIRTSREEAREKINLQIEKGNNFLAKKISLSFELESFKKDYKKWNDYNKELLAKLFSGNKIIEDYNRHTYISYSYLGGADEELKTYTKLITGAVNELESLSERIDLIPENSQSEKLKDNSPKIINNNIFIVHGHNGELKQTVARLVEKLSLNPIILHEQANSGMTVIEKIEKNADVGFAVILLTADDTGGEGKVPPDNFQSRARQNVIFELGYFIGKLGRDKVCALYEDRVELPSDMHGILYVKYDSEGSWKYQLCRELKSAGYNINMNKI